MIPGKYNSKLCPAVNSPHPMTYSGTNSERAVGIAMWVLLKFVPEVHRHEHMAAY